MKKNEQKWCGKKYFKRITDMKIEWTEKGSEETTIKRPNMVNETEECLVLLRTNEWK